MIGIRLGSYEIIENLGVGGMGEVYRGVDTQTGTLVAIKVLKSDLVKGKPRMLERFIREGAALRKLNHPNIVRMLEAGEQDGIHYIIMEYIGGGDLRGMLGKGTRMDLGQALAIALELADALTRAHHLHIIHRDIKPANVLLAENGTPFLTDFGIARYKEVENLTETGEFVGTFAYISPEVYLGQPLDERADIWSFGVMLYEMVGGKQPFKGDSAMGIIKSILNDDLPDLQAIRADVPDDLLDLLHRMVTKSREARIPSMRLVGAELEAIIKEGGLVDIAPVVKSERSVFATPAPDTEKRLSNLPRRMTPFIGRQKELEEVAALVKEDTCSLLTLLGPGGMGKTRLGIEAAARQVDAFSQGVYFVSLAPISSADQIVTSIAKAVGLQIDEESAPREQLLNYLCEKSILLVMDNFEHVLEGGGLVAEILNNSPKVRVIATSRARLNLAAERVYEVRGMQMPEDEGQEVFEEFDAVEMFIAYARRAQPDYKLTDEGRPGVVMICHLVDGMPLGIELAAAWARMLPPAEIAEELEADLGFLATKRVDVPERQRSMRAVFDYSWKLLNEHEQEALMKLTVFRGGFARKAGQTITGATLGTLTGLVDKSLVHRHPETGRFEIHELIRQFAGEALEVSGQTEAVRDMHSGYYADALHQRLADLKGRNQLETLAEIEIDFENVRMAWRWAVGRGDFDTIGLLIESVYLFGAMRSRIDDVEGLFRQARDELAPRTGTEAHLVWGRVVTHHEMTLWVNQIGEQARQPLENALAIARLHDDRWGEALALLALAMVDMSIDFDYERAASLLDRSAETFNDLDDPYYRARALLRLGTVYHERGDEEVGRKAVQRGLDVTRQIGDQFGLAEALLMLGMRFFMEDELAEADRCFRESGALCRKLGDLRGVARVAIPTGFIAEYRGDYDEVRRLAREALEIAEDNNNPSIKAGLIATLADMELRVENYEKARQLYEEARSLSVLDSQFRVTWGLGIISAVHGDIPAGKAHLREGIIITVSSKDMVAWAQVWMYLLAQQGQKERAVEMMAFSFETPFVKTWVEGFPWLKRLLAELEAELSPDDFEAAWERGRELDLEEVVAEMMAEEE